MKRVLIVGGYGVFGGRIVELLEDETQLELIVAGRSLERAKAYCDRRSGVAKLVPAIFDRNSDLARQLGALQPDILVDASGPFQGYGESRYRVCGRPPSVPRHASTSPASCRTSTWRLRLPSVSAHRRLSSLNTTPSGRVTSDVMIPRRAFS